ncbi:hypothetical protein BN1708_010286 [Verticillium longisporum]|uniref:Uncharacterized protein n=1 Tax=Verticillium longisporum TaxID=100787 RepID=A0A0G4KQT4_VERLO|nr:hypothetical protein BN1708_010286 [Verticillium longisporum]
MITIAARQQDWVAPSKTKLPSLLLYAWKAWPGSVYRVCESSATGVRGETTNVQEETEGRGQNWHEILPSAPVQRQNHGCLASTNALHSCLPVVNILHTNLPSENQEQKKSIVFGEVSYSVASSGKYREMFATPKEMAPDWPRRWSYGFRHGICELSVSYQLPRLVDGELGFEVVR